MTRSLTPELAATLTMVADTAGSASDPWWIIGSTAVVLHGGSVGRVKDVDLMMSARDADAFLRRAGVEPRRGAGDQQFRSQVFGVWSRPPIPVEAFGGFKLAIDGTWREVRLGTREEFTVAKARVYVPKRPELVQLLRSFGRPKDLERIELLQIQHVNSTCSAPSIQLLPLVGRKPSAILPIAAA